MLQTFVYKFFDAFTPSELYTVLRLRSDVFVVEQNCVFLEPDNKDQQCFHLMGMINETLASYARIVPPGVIYDEPSIGRIVSNSLYRRSGAGKELVAKAIKICNEQYAGCHIKIGAQLYLQKFYASFGFERISDVYLEDGIEHIYMRRK